MITLCVGQTELQIHWSFWLMLGLAAASPNYRLFLMSAAAAFCHEMGHFAALTAVGSRPRNLNLSMLGGKLTCREDAGLFKELFSVAAGPWVNLLLAACLWRAGAYDARLFSALNLVLGGFNLLPVQGMDGGRILYLLAERFCGIRRVRGICIAAACAALWGLAAWSFWLWRKHPQLPALLLFPLVPAAAFFRWLKD